MRKILVLAAAGAALAIGVPAAVALGDSPSQPATTPIQNTQPQQAQPEQERPDRDDCPEEEGRSQQGESSAPTANPEI